MTTQEIVNKLWNLKAGNNFRYFLVYDKRIVEGTCLVDDFMKLVREM